MSTRLDSNERHDHPQMLHVWNIYLHFTIDLRQSHGAYGICCYLNLNPTEADSLETTGSPPFRRTMWRRCYRTSWKWTMSSRNRSLALCTHLGIGNKEDPSWVVVSNIFYFHPYLGKTPILTNIWVWWLPSFRKFMREIFWRNPTSKETLTVVEWFHPPPQMCF